MNTTKTAFSPAPAREIASLAAPLWHSDCWLPADIRPAGLAANLDGAVVLTGATGYLGRHVLHALLLEGATAVYCLARSSAAGSAEQRVRQALSETPPLPASALNRLLVLEADLLRPDLGLPASDYAALAARTSALIHCAADVSWSRTYASMRASNVMPVQQLLRFACQGPAKHFMLVSSIAVCYSSNPLIHCSERTDPLQHVATLPLGYAQTKAVAERLARQAAARGLDVTVVRPALVTGHASGGQANATDFVAWLISGCIRMGWAPDVDWRFDGIPVDHVAAAIAANLKLRPGMRTLHVAHPEPRDWGELVLFLNLYGYPVRRESFASWLERLADFPDRALPLRRFLGFLGHGAAQIYGSGGSARISSSDSQSQLDQQDLHCPRLGAAYFADYLQSLVQAGLMAAPTRGLPATKRATPPQDAQFLALHLLPAAHPQLRLERLRAARFEAKGSITNEISSWRLGGCIGLHGVASGLQPGDAADLVLKIKARDEEAIAAATEVATVCSDELGQLFERFPAQLGFTGAAERECALYESAPAALTRFMPRCHAVGHEPEHGRPMLLLERLCDVELLDTVDRPAFWTAVHLRIAIRDLASIHSLSWGQLAAPDTGAVDILESPALWNGLLQYGRALLEECGGRELARRVGQLLADAERWVPYYMRQTPALIHNDCNPRNMTFRRGERGLTACLYDWELSLSAPPQRDLAELLCFTLEAPDAGSLVRDYVELHRQELARHTGTLVDAYVWQQGFRQALAEFAIRRLLMYSMLHSQVRQRFLPRVWRCWQALDRAMRD